MNRRQMLGLAAGGLAAPALLRAQEAWPSKPVTIIVPFAPGSSSDIVGRAIAQGVQAATGKPVVVENRPGATGEIGARVVIRSAPDGGILMHAPISTWAINAALRPNLSYDPTRDFTGLMQTVRTPNVLVVNPAQVPANDLPGFVAWLKERGGRAAYSSSGVGSSDHLTAEMFKQRTGTEASHAPYSGGGPATTDLIAGNVQFSFQNLGSIAPQIRDGRVKAIMTTAEARNPTLPETPTAGEAGLPDFVVYSWQALGAPAGMAPALAAQVHAACAAALRQPEIAKRLTDIGFEIVASTPADFTAFQHGEIARWKEVVGKGNIAPE
ncbi:tripartite tricarboxylate transporter substrate binding protein [Roseomonas sp. KE2513]|uniref:Bug family tripartite tricarboxylate transporter substrate binding protein n=1 Tax=Roseomonas sp. KE2513 TaxID=2479202 RepID=UPI0018DFF4EE|nr:tripartite tricarboxylate transporter substrate-binding protein [Roseomonas sp. KE2513]MBI0535977.1 tripartite tricarboxylate transporter substrate binding protein [Roseomonas sp. KE2513]